MLSHTNARPDIWMQQRHLSRMVQWRAIGRIRCKPLKNTSKHTTGPYGILGLQLARMDVSISVSRVSLGCCSAHAYWSAFTLLPAVQVNTLVSIPVSLIGLRTISGSNIGFNFPVKQDGRSREERNNSISFCFSPCSVLTVRKHRMFLSAWAWLNVIQIFFFMIQKWQFPFVSLPLSCAMEWLVNN